MDYYQVYCDQSKVEIVMISELTLEVAKNKILIIDEIDLMVNHFAVNFANGKGTQCVRGLISTRTA